MKLTTTRFENEIFFITIITLNIGVSDKLQFELNASECENVTQTAHRTTFWYRGPF